MKHLLRSACAIALALLPSTAFAQSVVSSAIFPSGWAPGQSICVQQADKTCIPVSTTNPLPVIGGTGGGGGGGTGDASAANQTTQITAANQTNTLLGALSSPATGSANQRLAAINTTLGSPFQVGGSIGNTAFGISGTLPAFAATPTVNLGTLGGAATSAKQDAMVTALGSPVQAGATLSNVVQAVATDRGAIVGTSAVQLMAANSARRGLSIQIQSTSASCYLNGTTGATADYHSLQIGPSGYFEPDHHVGTGAISIICTAASTPVYSREW